MRSSNILVLLDVWLGGIRVMMLGLRILQLLVGSLSNSYCLDL